MQNIFVGKVTNKHLTSTFDYLDNCRMQNALLYLRPMLMNALGDMQKNLEGANAHTRNSKRSRNSYNQLSNKRRVILWLLDNLNEIIAIHARKEKQQELCFNVIKFLPKMSFAFAENHESLLLLGRNAFSSSKKKISVLMSDAQQAQRKKTRHALQSSSSFRACFHEFMKLRQHCRG